MRIKRNQKPVTSNQKSETRNQNIFVFWAVVVSFVLFQVNISYSQETDLEELRVSLQEQEQQLTQQPREAVPGNRGYFASRKESPADQAVTAKPLPLVYITPDVQGQIRQLYQEAVVLFKEGRLDEAKGRLEKIIELNPLNVPARKFLKRIIDMQTGLLDKDTRTVAKERILEVDEAWLPPLKPIEEVESPQKAEPVKSAQQRLMEERARQTIPEINFTDAHIRDVLTYLSEVSGINIVVDEDVFPEVTAVEVSLTEETATVATASISPSITISLIDIPLIEALKYILSAKGLKYRIDEYAIVVTTPERLAEVEMETRYYHLVAGAGIFTEFAKRVREEGETEVRGIAKGLEAKKRITIKDVLEKSGVPFPPGSKVFLDQRSGTLIVRNTPANLELVEEVLRMLDVTPYQVEIEARFVEMTKDTSEELGLEWMITSDLMRFGKGKNLRWDTDTTDAHYGQFPDPTHVTGEEGVTHGIRYMEYSDVDDYHLKNDPYWPAPVPRGDILSLSGILTKPQFKMILHALDQSGCANVLSAPKVTTLNNQQAQIEVVDEVIYPTEFELVPPTATDEGYVVTQPAVIPAAFTTRDVGIILNVTPSVGADRKTVNLTLLPEVSELKTWVDYGIAGGDNWNAIPILQPIFYTKNVTTSVVIHDGETVVLAGLIKEDLVTTEDKIPVLGDIPILGRLFRNNTESSQKTNLVIFVTANLLSPSGEHIRE